MKDVVIGLIAWVVWFSICVSLVGWLAKRLRNRNPWPWGIVAGLFGPLTLVPTLLALFATSPLCPNCKQPLKTDEWKQKKCPKCTWSGEGQK